MRLLAWTAFPLFEARVNLLSKFCFGIKSWKSNLIISYALKSRAMFLICVSSLTILLDRVIVSINWKKYHTCVHPLHIWIVVSST